MRFVVGVLACLSVGAISLGLADPSTTAPAEPAPAAPAAAATTPAATPHAAPAAPATPAVDPEEKHLLAQGYRMKMRHGERVFCRREEVLGTRLGGRNVCATKEQLKVTEKEAKELAAELQRRMRNPNPSENPNPSGK